VGLNSYDTIQKLAHFQSEIMNTEVQDPVITRRGGSRWNSLAAAVSVFLITILIFCAGLEIGLRIIYARSLDFSIEMWKYAVALKQPVANPNLSFAHRPNSSAFLMGVPVSINSHGLRDREYSETKAPGVTRVLMLGDSTTLGWGVREEDTTAKILERELNELDPHHPYEALNAGVGNYGSVQEYNHYITYDRAYHPDVVVLEYSVNDPEPVPKEKVTGPLAHSYLFAFTASRFDRSLRVTGSLPNWKEYYRNLYRADSPAYAAAKQALLDLSGAVQADGGKLLVAMLPELHEINNGYPFAEQFAEVERMLNDHQIQTIDLTDGLKGHGPESTLWVTPADAHPNLKANTLIVAQILPEVLKLSQGANSSR
jgi:hypothetical protein